jgi:hypothetical protein
MLPEWQETELGLKGDKSKRVGVFVRGCANRSQCVETGARLGSSCPATFGLIVNLWD